MARLTIRFYNHKDATKAVKLLGGELLDNAHASFKLDEVSESAAMVVFDQLEDGRIDWRDAEF